MREVKVSASILSADFSKLEEEVRAVSIAGADLLHIDVMDGMFVPNITMGPKIISDIRKCSSILFDVHLMIMNPDRYIAAFANAGSDLITVHIETVHNIEKTIDLIRSFNKKVGISIAPSTTPECLDPLYDKIDLVLVMTVEPGFAGQTFMVEQLDKILTIRKKIGERRVMLSVDGGIDELTAHMAKERGAGILVAGSAVFKGGYDQYKANIERLRHA